MTAVNPGSEPVAQALDAPLTGGDGTGEPAVTTCDCCGESYDDPNDLLVFGTLVMSKPLKRWKICGPCIQAMWAERRPALEPIA